MKKVTIFFITSFDDIYKDVQRVVNIAVDSIQSTAKGKYEIDLITIDNFSISSVTSQVLHFIQTADIIISNLSSITPNAMYEIGISHALKKPTILLVNNNLQVPFDIGGYRYFTYDSDSLRSNSLIDKLTKTIIDALNHPDNWVPNDKSKEKSEKIKTVFVSYSHRDTIYLDRLKVHLRPLERKGSVQLWSDTLIQSGDKWKQEIEKALGKAAIAVLLISADFLASDFIINNELQPLLKKAEDKGTIIIPVVLKPCRFLREQTISQFQAINDPLTPLCNMTEYEREDIYERLAQRIELALEAE